MATPAGIATKIRKALEKSVTHVVVSWHKEARTASSTGTPTVVADPLSPYTTNISSPKRLTDYVDGDVVRTNVFKSVIAAERLLFTPEVGDVVELDAVRYRVLDADAVYAGVTGATNTIVAYTVRMEA